MKNTHGGVLLLVTLQASAYNFTKSNTPPLVFFTFFELYKWYLIAQSITIVTHFNCYQLLPLFLLLIRTRSNSCKNPKYIHTLRVNVLFLYPLEISENLQFSDKKIHIWGHPFSTYAPYDRFFDALPSPIVRV